MDAIISKADRAQVLVQALPYIQQYYNRVVVIKYGGHAMENEELKAKVMEDIVLLQLVGVRVVLVHGGGPDISEVMDKMGVESRFVNGLRVTDQETAAIAQMVLAGKVGKSLVNLIEATGGKAMGICGIDGRMVEAKTKDAGLGYVGEITHVNTQPIYDLIERGYIPVISSVGCDAEGNVYNINADTMAAQISGAMGAECLISMTDVPGIMLDPADPASLVHVADINDATELFRRGVISGGMIPKVESCIEALLCGVHKVFILDGRDPALDTARDAHRRGQRHHDGGGKAMNTRELDAKYIAGTYARFPVVLTHGKGSVVWDEDGKEYIDMGSGIAVNAFGIADAEWIAAVTAQLGKLQHSSNLYFTEPDALLAEQLCSRTGMKKVFFANSGAEANECAIKCARKYAADKYGAEKRYKIVTLVNSFHGRTVTTLAATGQDEYHQLFQPLTPGFLYAAANDCEAPEGHGRVRSPPSRPSCSSSSRARAASCPSSRASSSASPRSARSATYS